MRFSFGKALVLAVVLASLGVRSGQAQNPGSDRSTAPSGDERSSAGSNKPHDDSYVIGNDDVLAISVWNEPNLTKSIPVRSDGKISMPLIGEMQASGRTPLQLEREITGKLKNYITAPQVSVIVEKINSKKFNILGEVIKPGSYPTSQASTIVDAIALAGGFRDFAKQKSIYVLRHNPNGTEARLPFNYKDVVKGKNPDQNVKLQPNDTIVIP